MREPPRCTCHRQFQFEMRPCRSCRKRGLTRTVSAPPKTPTTAAGTTTPLTTSTPAAAKKAAGTLYDGSGMTVGSVGCVAAARAFLLKAPNCARRRQARRDCTRLGRAGAGSAHPCHQTHDQLCVVCCCCPVARMP